ncbi:hypothetical protein EV426DRAFT_195737 [Tirmania nivea]|nr:hypothetical protein EV426DRAFT_195737 [Tirmania nivea]
MAIPNSPRHPPLTENTPLLYSPPPPPSIPANTPIPPYYQPRTRRSQYPSPSRSITPIQSGSAVSTPSEDYSAVNHYGDEFDSRGTSCCCCGSFISLVDFLLIPWRTIYTYCCGCLGSRRGRGIGARRPRTYSRSQSESSFYDYSTSRDFSPARSQSITTATPELGRRGRGRGIGRERLGDAYSPYSPHSPYSPYVPGQGAGAFGGGGGVGSAQQDYFSPRGSYNRTTGLPHAPQPPQYYDRSRYTRDSEPDLGPGYTSHFLPGSYSRTTTNTQPTTRASTNTVPSPRGEGETDEYNAGSGGMVAYGHGYDATRQRMIYRQILAIDQEITAGGAVDRGYEGGDEDTETGTSTSGIGSASASGRTSPYEERGRPRRGSSWWGMGYRFVSSPARGGQRRREMRDEDVESMEPHGEYYGEVGQQQHHLPPRPRWGVGAIEGLAPSPVSPAVTAIRYGSNDNTPRPVHILDVVHGPTHAGGVPEQAELRHEEREESASNAGPTIEQSRGEVQANSSGVDDLIPLPPALDSSSEIDLSPSSAAAAELEQLRSGNLSGSLVNTNIQSQIPLAAAPSARGASTH